MDSKIYLISLETVYRNHELTEGAADLMDYLMESSVPFALFTNDTRRTADRIKEDLLDAGYKKARKIELITSLSIAAEWITEVYPGRIRASYIGGRAMKEMLEDSGFTIDHTRPDWLFIGTNRNFAFSDYCAVLRMAENGSVMIASDMSACVTRSGQDEIGAGAVVKMLEYASGKKAVDLSDGSMLFVNRALLHMNAEAADTELISDVYDPHVLTAIRAGMETVLVTHGAGIDEMGVTGNEHPKWIVEELSGLTR